MRTTHCAPRSSWLARATGLLLVAAGTLLPTSPAFGQLPQTRLYALAPSGGTPGSSFDVKIASGADTDELSKLVFNHAGITAALKSGSTFTVKIAANVPTGLYEVRAAGQFGLSNPRTFTVGRFPNVTEKESNNTPKTASPIAINKTVDAAIGSGADIDYFQFVGKKNQRVTLDCRAARIDSRLRAAMEVIAPNGRRIAFSRRAVRQDPLTTVTLPVDGTYLVKLYDFTYRGGADYFYRLSVHTAPHIDFILPASGVPGKTGKFTIYGRNLPGGKPVDLEIDIPMQKVEVSIPLPNKPYHNPAENLSSREAGEDVVSWVWKSPAGNSNPVQIHLASAPVLVETEPNDDAKQAQKITVPTEVSGHFQDRGDVDYFTFQAKAKEVFYIEVFSQRLGTTADPYLRIQQITKDKKGVEIVKNLQTADDITTNLAANVFNTATDDPAYRFTAPVDGTFRLVLRDRYYEARGDPRLVYRLSIRRPQPDFRVVVLPVTPPRQRNQPTTMGALALRKGENLPARVLIFRKDGFDGTVEITAQGLPKGIVCKGASVGKGQSSSSLIFTSDEKAAAWSGLIKVVAKAKIDDAGKIAAETKAAAAIKPATDALPALRKAVPTAEAAFKKVDAQLKQAQAAAKKNPKNEALANRVKAAQKTADAAGKKFTAAKAALAAGEKRLADAQAALKRAQAEHAASAKTVVRHARPATIVWNGQNNVAPSVTRVARSLGLSVMNEDAPVQLTTDVFRVEANQGRQILIPAKLARRAGFNNTVTVTFDGLPKNSGLQVQNKNIAKGKNSELYRVFVGTSAKPGIYSFYLKSQAQIPYRKNLKKLQAAQAEQKKLAKVAADAANVAKSAATKLTAAGKKAAADAAKVKTATTAKATTQKNATAAQTTLKAATTAKAKNTAALPIAAAAVKTTAAKLATAKKAQKGDPKQKKLADAAAVALKAFEMAQTKHTAAKAAKIAADRKHVAATTAANKATAASTAANKVFATAQAAAKVSADAKTKAAAESKTQADKSKAAAAAKKAIDGKVASLNKTAKARNILIYPPSTPIIIHVKKAPAKLSASVPGGGNIKRGAKLAIKVSVQRTNGFKGPVTLSLPLPPGVKGLTAGAVTISADKKDGVLTIQVAKDATVGQLANMVVRATMQFEGKAAVDAPVKIKVAK